jgi:hypothetical protein
MTDEQRSRLARAAEAFRERYNSPKFADDITEALATIKAQEDVISACNAGLTAVELLIEQSAGVDGLHLNGDMAPWDELRRDGRYCEWLNDYDAARDAIAAWRAKYGSKP